MNTSHHIHAELARDVQARRIAEARIARTAARRAATETVPRAARRSLLPAFLTRSAARPAA